MCAHVCACVLLACVHVYVCVQCKAKVHVKGTALRLLLMIVAHTCTCMCIVVYMYMCAIYHVIHAERVYNTVTLGCPAHHCGGYKSGGLKKLLWESRSK